VFFFFFKKNILFTFDNFLINQINKF